MDPTLKVKIFVAVLVSSAGFAAVSASNASPAAVFDGFGFVDTSSGVWHLYDDGVEITTFTYGNPGDLPFAGDWDCDGVDTAGLYRQSNGFVYLRNTNTNGVADVSFLFGDLGDRSVAGDWTGNGADTPRRVPGVERHVLRPLVELAGPGGHLPEAGERGVGPGRWQVLVHGTHPDHDHDGSRRGDGHVRRRHGSVGLLLWVATPIDRFLVVGITRILWTAS